MATKGKAKKKQPSGNANNGYQLKIVTSDVCAVCKTPCARGLRYLERMRVPGASGNGVPCILTRYKA
ncbi:hypothetical protein [Paenibacillus sp. HJGM_3]|uniref:hypothetical protein n=1 Tax=Paenibacillus sp. HJGM_3 TaxID=3379816 RepID=UPI00385D01F3